MTRYVLCDIEGTTTSLSFVQDVLFPISYEKMESYLSQEEAHQLFGKELEVLCEKLGFSEKNFALLASYFRDLIQKDIKDPLLKKIQGRIWKEAYEKGQIKGHLYPDVPKAFEAWQKKGIGIFIYSSGSVQAQKLLFQYSEFGDLTHFIKGYFDTSLGPKKEASSYEKIASQLKEEAQKILFLSDNQEELHSANRAQMKVARILRPGVLEDPDLPYPQLPDFLALERIFF